MRKILLAKNIHNELQLVRTYIRLHTNLALVYKRKHLFNWQWNENGSSSWTGMQKIKYYEKSHPRRAIYLALRASRQCKSYCKCNSVNVLLFCVEVSKVLNFLALVQRRYGWMMQLRRIAFLRNSWIGAQLILFHL